MENSLKTAFVQTITSATVLPIAKIGDEGKIRVVIENASGSNTVTISARIIGQSDWDLLSTITGSIKSTINVSTYDEMLVECTTYDSVSNYVKVLLSSFNEAGGSTSIDAPSGGTVDSSVINFTSSDNSVIITGDPETNSIDFVAISGGGASAKYVKTLLLTDWVGPSAGEYSVSIPFSFHGKSNPVVTLLETSGSDFEVVDASVLITGNDVKILVLSSPDTRFVGKIIID